MGADVQGKKKGLKKANKKPQQNGVAPSDTSPVTDENAAPLLNGTAKANGSVKSVPDAVKLTNGAPVGVEPRSTKLLEKSKQRAIVKQLSKQADQQVRDL